MAPKKKVVSIDIEADAASARPTSAKDLAAVQALAEEMRGIESYLEQLQRIITLKTERYTMIQNVLLPDLMTQVGMSKFTLVTGEEISIKDVVRASIPSMSAIEKADGPDKAALEKRRDDCLAWLRKNKAESLIKTELTASFGKGQGKEAAKLRALIIKQGFPATLEEAVNFQTLNKFIRERLAAGDKVPEETFALFTGKQAAIAAPRKKST